jgi:hypothetical protein
MTKKIKLETKFKMLDVWVSDGIRSPGITQTERHDQIDNLSALSPTPFSHGVANKQCEMPIYEEAIVVLFWFCCFGLVLYGPVVACLLLYFKPKLGVLFVAIIVGTSLIIPSKFSQGACSSYISTLILKYFSYKAIWQEYPDHSEPFIAVCPPHGLFPFGGIAGAIAIPR